MSHRIEAQITYLTKDDWYVTNAYGALRNEEDSIGAVKSIKLVPRNTAFYKAPGGPLASGMDRNYLAFFYVGDTEASSQALRVGQKIKVSWSDPNALKNSEKDKSSSPFEWNGIILPQLLDIQAYGNMTMHLSRPTHDKREVEVNRFISPQMIPAAKPIWIYPMDSDLPGKRLINALNQVYKGNTKAHHRLRSLLRATDFSQLRTRASLSSLPSYQSKAGLLQLLQSELSPSQQKAWAHIMESTSFVELITGPFGTGKTTFLTQLILALCALGIKVLVCCSSNTAINTIADKIEVTDPKLKALRFHSLAWEIRQTEARAAAAQKASTKNSAQAQSSKEGQAATDVVDGQGETAKTVQSDNETAHGIGDNEGKATATANLEENTADYANDKGKTTQADRLIAQAKSSKEGQAAIGVVDKKGEAIQLDDEKANDVADDKGKASRTANLKENATDLANKGKTTPTDQLDANAAESDDAGYDADLAERRMAYARVIPICLWIANQA